MKKKRPERILKRFQDHMSQHHLLYLVLIIIISLVLRARFLNLCDVGDRGQVVFGMTNNLPPLFHYISAPFLYMTNNLWYSPAFANLLLAVLSTLVIYLIGHDIKNRNFGLLSAFLFAVFPPAILVARYISPEQTELFFILLISYLFIRLEVLEKKGYKRYMLVLYFLALAIGAFSKQQTLFILIPIFVFGLFKHRWRIFRTELYYISAFAVLPYIFFLFAHPEMFAAVLIYFIQPSGQLSLADKSLDLLFKGLSTMLPYLLIMAVYLCSLAFKRWRSRCLSKIDLFILIVLISYIYFLIKTSPSYFYLLSLPVLYYTIMAISALRNPFVKAGIIILLIIYCVFGFYFAISGLSLNTLERCEHDVLGIEPNPILDLSNAPRPVASDFFQVNSAEIHEILKDEQYIIIGGDTGQNLKYNIRKRLYYGGIMNSDRFSEINYALLVYPIDVTYTGAPAWDYSYSSFIETHSESILNESYVGGRRLVLWHITNHSREGLVVSDFRERSLEGLKLNSTILSAQ